MNSVTLLHVSDVHFGVTDLKGEQSRITDQLIAAAHRHVEMTGVVPDICVFSGDLTQAASGEQFERGEDWLGRLVEPWDCVLFIVPGNHDVTRPGDADERARVTRDLRAAHHNEGTYRAWHKIIESGQLLRRFADWHESARHSGLPLISDWSGSLLACRATHRVRSIDVSLIGLNSALLSCDDHDRPHLAVDVGRLNRCLGETDPKTSPVLVVGHHPVAPDSEKWLVEWNREEVETLLLQATGPHIYFHGHLHEPLGGSISQSTGQFLTTLAAGAAYQGSDYPQTFAFYRIDLEYQEIQPAIYSFERQSGKWHKDHKQSEPFRTVLPLLRQPARAPAPESGAPVGDGGPAPSSAAEARAAALASLARCYPGFDDGYIEYILDNVVEHWSLTGQWRENCITNIRLKRPTSKALQEAGVLLWEEQNSYTVVRAHREGEHPVRLSTEVLIPRATLPWAIEFVDFVVSSPDVSGPKDNRIHFNLRDHLTKDVMSAVQAGQKIQEGAFEIWYEESKLFVNVDVPVPLVQTQTDVTVTQNELIGSDDRVYCLGNLWPTKRLTFDMSLEGGLEDWEISTAEYSNERYNPRRRGHVQRTVTTDRMIRRIIPGWILPGLCLFVQWGPKRLDAVTGSGAPQIEDSGGPQPQGATLDSD